MEQPLKDVVKIEGNLSDTVYVSGIRRRVTAQELEELLNRKHRTVQVDHSLRKRTGKVWAKYECGNHALETILEVNQTEMYGSYLCVKFEMGVDQNGKPIVSALDHTTVIRKIRRDRNSSEPSYSHKSLTLGKSEYPFPTGLYLARVIQLMANIEDRNDPALKIVTECAKGSKFSKEISETMAMVDATERACKIALLKPTSQIDNAIVYVLGDGKTPLCAAAMALEFPQTWTYHSIDPIMETTDRTFHGTRYENRIVPHKLKSQDFDLEMYHDQNASLTIIVACHSHAPLLEFHNRLKRQTPTLCIAMPCCADYSDLPDEPPVLSFQDFEVYSPKRTINIYRTDSNNNKKAKMN